MAPRKKLRGAISVLLMGGDGVWEDREVGRYQSMDSQPPVLCPILERGAPG